MNLTLIGTGVRKEDLSLRALSAIKRAEKILLKTDKMPVAELLKEEGIPFTALDGVWEKSRNFDTLRKNLAKEVLSAAKTASVCYLVDGSLTEDRTVALLLKKHKDIQTVEGVSKAAQAVLGSGDVTYTALSAYDVAGTARFTLPLAVYDLDCAETASEVKLRLSELFGEETPVLFLANGKKKRLALYEIDREKDYGAGAVIYLEKQDFLTKERYDFYDIVHLVRLLRAENGCPWDRVQTHDSLRQDLLEEAYELVSAIDKGDLDNMEEETGDVLLQGAFHAVISEENGEFTEDDVTTRLCKKLISRHSHVFGSDSAQNKEDALSVWDANKKKEKSQRTATDAINDLPPELPQLLRAEKVKKRARKVGFDWKTVSGVIDKLKEEVEEVERAYASESEERIREECGDLLLAAACVVSQLGFHPELTLKEGTDKFVRRFSAMERRILADGKEPSSLTDEEYDAYWNLSKKD